MIQALDVVKALRTTPSGKHMEPRVTAAVEARLLSVPGAVVSSGTAPTNITGVGMGKTAASHKDLRFNILRVIGAGIQHVAAANGVSVPDAGDVALIELPSAQPARITFVTGAKACAPFLTYCTAGRSSWGWAPAAIVPAWP